ncbi:DNA ligase [Methylophilus sp. TWE2]|uniref:DNA ligase n=1 Tax=Methylophilus sp. TWE2 TaxID=1662285 RepID=UPI0006717055|nr:DNA ligase [Methylophilus sp. TWE2]AKR43080.1 DNA ligase [Methylophilus sp. TWE2]
MLRLIRHFLLLCCFFGAVHVHAQAPAILLAQIYNEDIPVQDYLVSEKLDGIRAIWDGQQLISRHGHPIHAPAWFTKNFPAQMLDGELWIARSRFEQLSSTVRQSNPNDAAWRQVAYYVFELPEAEGDFSQRVQRIAEIARQVHSPYLKPLPQFRVSDRTKLKRTLDSIVAKRGEGLMLHRADAPYLTGRSHVLLKLKPQLDAEAKVIAYVPGKGKYQGKMGALLVEMPDGTQFKLGTGFKDAERAHPPPIGSQVTYTYRDVTKNGKPKFASFLRVRPPE